MRLLLDTQVFLWLTMQSHRLTGQVRELLENIENYVYLSAASAWEIGIKCGLGKLSLPGDPMLFVPTCIKQLGLNPMPVTIEHGLGVRSLPPHHSDPFDRLLAAQAQMEMLTLVTADEILAEYPIRTLLV